MYWLKYFLNEDMFDHLVNDHDLTDEDFESNQWEHCNIWVGHAQKTMYWGARETIYFPGPIMTGAIITPFSFGPVTMGIWVAVTLNGRSSPVFPQLRVITMKLDQYGMNISTILNGLLYFWKRSSLDFVVTHIELIFGHPLFLRWNYTYVWLFCCAGARSVDNIFHRTATFRKSFETEI